MAMEMAMATWVHDPATKHPESRRPTLKFSPSTALERRNLEDVFTRASYGTEINFQPNQQKLRAPSALLGGGRDRRDGQKKKFISREEEPDQYWQTAAEKEGTNPMLTPLPYIIIFGFLTPFIILAVGFANGWIKVPVR